MNLLKKLLLEGRSRWQVYGATFGALLGLFLLLSAVQLYADVHELISGSGNGSDQYVQINKQVNLFNMLGVKPNFTEEEIQTIEEQSFVKAIGNFTPSQFRVSASMSSLGFRTDLFFEAVPDEFLDVDEPDFKWRKGQKEVPVIISRDYLALYNFGFAPSQGLPALTPGSISKFSATINISGKGLRQSFDGRIVGLSDRINSILVPTTFMEWANDNFGSGRDFNSSRLILAVDNPLSRELKTFLEENAYEVSQGRLIGGQFGVLLNILVGVIALIGFVILLLSVLVFILNFQLTVSQAKEDISRLLQIGYRTKQIEEVLIRQLTVLFAQILAATFVLFFALRWFQQQLFQEQGFDLPLMPHWTVFAAAILFTMVFGWINVRNIQKSVRSLG